MFDGDGSEEVFVESTRQMCEDDENGRDAAEALKSVVSVAVACTMRRDAKEGIRGRH